MSIWNEIVRLLQRILRSPEVRRAARRMAREALGDKSPQRSGPRGRPAADRPAGKPLRISYSPVDDDKADPGEIVWAWVPFEEDASKGKDRPVLVLAREAGDLVCLMLTSRDRGRGVHTDRHGNTWVDIGTGPWDKQGRPSEVRINRLLRIDPDDVRREGARLDRRRFDLVADETRRLHRW
ncbi:type II toxin-antitoxin system PemK/MazF family toxin [Dermabacteraceae bacterium P13115]